MYFKRKEFFYVEGNVLILYIKKPEFKCTTIECGKSQNLFSRIFLIRKRKKDIYKNLKKLFFLWKKRYISEKETKNANE